MKTSTLLIVFILATIFSSAQKIKVVKNAQNRTLIVDSISGNVIREYNETRYIKGGGFIVLNMQGKWGFVNENWEEVIPAKFNNIAEARLGSITQFIAEYGGFYSILDSTGKSIIDIQFQKVEPLTAQGLKAYRCKLSEKYGIVDASGEVVVPFMYDEVATFYHNVARTRIENRFGYISYTGKTIVEPRFEAADELVNKQGFVTENGQSYQINLEGVLTRKERSQRLSYNQVNLLVNEPKQEFGYATMVDGKNILFQLNGKPVKVFYDSIRMDASSTRYVAYHRPKVTIYEKIGTAWSPVTIDESIFRKIVLFYNQGTDNLTALIIDKQNWGLYYLNKKILVPPIFREHKWNDVIDKYIFGYDGDWYDVTVIDQKTLKLNGDCGTCSGTGTIDGKICSKCKGMKTLQRILTWNGAEYVEGK
jgi:hypothetical protein